MRKLALFAAVFNLLLHSFASATIINIPADYSTIQAGIDISVNGDTVLVQPGTYTENINFNGHNIILGSLLLTTGVDSFIVSTILDGDSSGSVISLQNGEDSTAIITGFTIQHGNALNGAGIYCFHSSPRIVNNIIEYNLARRYDNGGLGGGIYCHGSKPSINDNSFIRNIAAGLDPPYGNAGIGGAIYCTDSCDAAIINNVFLRNSANGGGGGIYCTNFSNLTISNNTFARNYSVGAGGTVCSYNSSPAIVSNEFKSNYGLNGGAIAGYGGSECFISRNVITKNGAGIKGGGIVAYNSDLIISSNIIFANSAERGSGIYFHNSRSEVTNTIIWSNTASNGANIYINSGNPIIRYCAVPEILGGEGNISANPLFLDPYNGDFNICAQSPCLDAGDPNVSDPDGSRSDIGLYFAEHPECPMGNVFNVSTSGDDMTGDGSLQNPFRTINRAVNASFRNDTVIVQNGVYVENVNFYGKNIVLASNFVYSADTSDIVNTIIEGDSNFTVIYLVGCDSTTSVIGLTIRRGFGESGGGILCSSSNPTIEHNIISANFGRYGAGIYLLNSRPKITDNIIENNKAIFDGGGIYCLNSSNAIITNNKIAGNDALYNGGGIYCGGLSCPMIKNNTISDNRVRGFTIFHGGGGIYCDNSSPLIIQNLIVRNDGNRLGGGIFCYENSDPLIINNTITANSSDSLAGGIYFLRSDAHILNTILWDNEPSEISILIGAPEFTYCDIQGGWAGDGNIDIDPLFRNPAQDDFHLMSMSCSDALNSPCIDAGDSSFQDDLLDCAWGLGTIRSDMGAYGGADSAMVGIDEGLIQIPGKFALSQNYPNPFNAQTAINYVLPIASEVSVNIFDILGRKLVTLYNGRQQAGNHRITWDANEQSSGVYFYRIQVGNYAETRKMVLLK